MISQSNETFEKQTQLNERIKLKNECEQKGLLVKGQPPTFQLVPVSGAGRSLCSEIQARVYGEVQVNKGAGDLTATDR